ncbi:ankyrin-1-like [Trichogramma pretiosum]|uniref:ankyrin-1-like n=1 Tax=Trichogramma pretiosum TaxID=7493 RepID=UPI0006C9A645|nr:ankyrin-1-like [Trichogramma pretiosum]
MSQKVDLELNRWKEENHRRIENERIEYFGPLYMWIKNWVGPLPNLRDHFRKDQIENILKGAVECSEVDIIRFVIKCGYKDVPDVDKDGKSVLRRSTPVHFADRYGLERYHLLDDLFKIYDKFDVNYVDENEVTHFHVACKANCKYVVEKFLELGQDPNCRGQKSTNSPLYSAVSCGRKWEVELLLRRGADPNLANAEGLTPLHAICNIQYLYDYYTPPNDRLTQFDILKYFLEINDEIQQTVHVNAQDKEGNTPLHLALRIGRKEVIEYLLGRGADPNLANDKGFTPLHTICNHWEDRHVLMKTFFKVCKAKRQLVQVDARDKSGLTPLQWAVACLSLKTVDVLLKNGADLSSFVLPTTDHFCQVLNSRTRFYHFQSDLAASAMELVELLTNREYELDRGDALTIMELFAKYGLFQKSEDLDNRWYDEDWRFVAKAKKIKINSSQSLYDLIQLRPEEAARRFARADLLKFGHSKKLRDLHIEEREACYVHLCETLSRRFFLRWAGPSLWQVVHYRLPILCCEMINEVLMNEDLRNICLTAERLSS